MHDSAHALTHTYTVHTYNDTGEYSHAQTHAFTRWQWQALKALMTRELKRESE